MAGTLAFSGKSNGTAILAGLINFEFDAFDITSKTIDGPTEVKYYKNGLTGTLVATITITYDVGGDIKTVERT